MESEIKNLLSVFEKYDGKQFVLVEPGGNHGDYLIYYGAEKLAREAGIYFENVSHHEFMEANYDSDTVIYLH